MISDLVNKRYNIKRMSKIQVRDIAITWAALEGWNPGLDDAEIFYQADNKGFLVGVLDNKPIACISVVKYDKSFGFLGFYIVKPEFRGKGYGLKIWQAGMAYLQKCNIGLDGVVAQQDNYKKSGFKLAYNNIRFKGVTQSTKEKSKSIVGLEDISFDKIERYDRKFFPVSRRNFLKRWIRPKHGAGLAFLKNGDIAGYGVIRKCIDGYKIGPLFAEEKYTAEELFKSLSDQVEVGSTIYLDIPEVNQDAKNIIQKYQMKEVFKTARMYTKELPDLSVGKIFGVTTFELG